VLIVGRRQNNLPHSGLQPEQGTAEVWELSGVAQLPNEGLGSHRERSGGDVTRANMSPSLSGEKNPCSP
jgi:hypothetical protein